MGTTKNETNSPKRDGDANGCGILEYLSLISDVCTELESYLGFGDKVSAEYIMELGRNSRTADEFNAKLNEQGAGFPDYFARKLLTIIHAVLPPQL